MKKRIFKTMKDLRAWLLGELPGYKIRIRKVSMQDLARCGIYVVTVIDRQTGDIIERGAMPTEWYVAHKEVSARIGALQAEHPALTDGEGIYNVQIG